MFPPATPALTPIAVKRTVLEQVKGSHPFIDRETGDSFSLPQVLT